MGINWHRVRTQFQDRLGLSKGIQSRIDSGTERYAEIRKEALQAVERWEWFSGRFYDVEPLYFVLERFKKPGKRLSTEPRDFKDAVCYGLDAQGRVRAERIFPGSDKEYYFEQFWEYVDGRVDVFNYQAIKPKKCIEATSLVMEGNQVAAAFSWDPIRPMLEGRVYEYEEGQLARVIDASFGSGKQWVYKLYTFTYQNGAMSKVEWNANWKYDNRWVRRFEVPGGKPSKPPVLDLRKEMKRVEEMLKKGVDRFAARQKGAKASGGGKWGGVSGIGLEAWWQGDAGTGVLLHLDTREQHEADGEWTHHDWARLNRKEWNRFMAACEEKAGGGILIDAGGSERKLTSDTPAAEQAAWFGEMFVQALEHARKKGVFKKLVKAPRCALSVEDPDNGFGWPRDGKVTSESLA